MNKLTIFWNDKTDRNLYWLSNEKNTNSDAFSAIHPLDSHALLKADLAGLADTAQGKKVELVLSSSDVHFNHVKLPNKAQRHLRKAVPFLLEEQLSEPVDSVFIAIGDRQKDDLIPVRAINLDYLQQIIAAFEQAEITLDSIRVDLDLLAAPETGFRLVIVDEKILVAEHTGHKWSCHLDDFFWLSQRFVEQEHSEEELPVAIPLEIICESEDNYKNFEHQLPVGQFAPSLRLVESTWQQLVDYKQPLFSLLQGEFEPKAESSPLKNMLLKVASIAGIVLAAHLLYQGSQLFWLSAQADVLTKQKVGLWKQAFPGRKVPANQDRELKSYLKTLEGGQGEGAFLAMLKSSSTLIGDLDKLYPTNVSYSAARSELRLDLIAKDLPVLNQYRDALKGAGFDVDMSSATQRGDGYSSRLVVRRK